MIDAPKKVGFTVFEDKDGYWFARSAKEADPKTVQRPATPPYTTKISACKAALDIAVSEGATELHLFGMGSTTTIKKLVKQKGLTPYIYLASIRSQIAPYVKKKQVNF